MPHQSPKWKVILVESNDLSNVYDLTNVASSKNFQIALNKAGSFTFNVPITHEIAPELNVINRGIKLYKNNVPIWSGFILNKSTEVPSNKVSVNTVGWFTILGKRLLEDNVQFEGPSNRGTIAHSLLTTANAQKDTWINVGTNNHTFEFSDTVTYQKHSSIGQLIQNLSDIESGFDWSIDPETRDFDLEDSDSPTIRDNVIFGYNKLTNNIQQLSETVDGNEMVNKIFVLGRFLTATAEDTAAQNEYQLFHRTDSLSEITDNIILGAYANGEIAVSARPRVIYSFTPFPVATNIKEDENVPSIFEDYNIGDIAYLSADYGSLQINKQAVRVFGTSIGIDEEGNESVGSIQTTNV